MVRSFIGPFLLTTAVANFILLLVNLLKYFDDFIGKSLGADVFARLFFYFSLNTLQFSLPLGVLVASLMTFGNLGESFELTAIKSSGISLVRTLKPLFIAVIFITFGSYYFNDIIIPNANLKAYSLLYDIKHAKPALDIKEGMFYEGLPNFSIKVKKKFPDGKSLKNIMIYDHTEGIGNRSIILADSSRMYSFMDKKYLKLELYNGNYYSETPVNNSNVNQLARSKFDKMDMVFSLASFGLERRDEDLFKHNRQMMNIKELTQQIDTFQSNIIDTKEEFVRNSENYFNFHLKTKKNIKYKYIPKADTATNIPSENEEDVQEASFLSPIFNLLGKIPQNDTIIEPEMQQQEIYENQEMPPTPEELPNEIPDDLINEEIETENPVQVIPDFLDVDSLDIDSLTWANIDSIIAKKKSLQNVYNNAASNAQNIQNYLSNTQSTIYQYTKHRNLFIIERDKKYSQAIACMIMFLIGAPLGSIIKKGGLGTPTIVAVFFFIIHYVFVIVGQQQAKEGAMSPYLAVWMADLILLPFALFFLRQAWVDARLFEVDFYSVLVSKIKKRFGKNN